VLYFSFGSSKNRLVDKIWVYLKSKNPLFFGYKGIHNNNSAFGSPID
jgi:hypothetical protein